MIADVHEIKGPSGTPIAAGDSDELASEAANAPGSEQLIVLSDSDTGEGLVIHLWDDRSACEAFAARRQELTAQSEGQGSTVGSGRFYEVTYRS